MYKIVKQTAVIKISATRFTEMTSNWIVSDKEDARIVNPFAAYKTEKLRLFTRKLNLENVRGAVSR